MSCMPSSRFCVNKFPPSGLRAPDGTRPVVISSPALLVFCVGELLFYGTLRQSYRVLNFLAQGKPLPAFLAAAAAGLDPPRAALVVGSDSARVDAVFLDAVLPGA